MSDKIKQEELDVNVSDPTQVPGTAPKTSKLGVKKDLEAKSGIPINTPRKLASHTVQFPNGYDFPVAKLVNVVFNPAKEVERNGIKTPTPIISFVFKGADDKQFTSTEFPLDEDDVKFDMKLEALQKRFKHIFDETVGAQFFTEGCMEGDTFAELFENVANAFNSNTYTTGEGETLKTFKRYAQSPQYLKLVYYGTRIQIPMFPNFIQRATKGADPVPCELRVVIGQDQIEAKEKAKVGATGFNVSSGAGAGLPEFGAGGDFPDISNLM